MDKTIFARYSKTVWTQSAKTTRQQRSSRVVSFYLDDILSFYFCFNPIWTALSENLKRLGRGISPPPPPPFLLGYFKSDDDEIW